MITSTLAPLAGADESVSVVEFAVTVYASFNCMTPFTLMIMLLASVGAVDMVKVVVLPSPVKLSILTAMLPVKELAVFEAEFAVSNAALACALAQASELEPPVFAAVYAAFA